MTSMHPTMSRAANTADHPYIAMDAAVRHALRRDLGRLVEILDEPITDVRRAALTQHIRFLTDHLQRHHRLQDEVIWPRVEVERADLAELAERVRVAHADLGTQIRDLRGAAQNWSSVPALRTQVRDAVLALQNASGPVFDDDADGLPIACEVLSAQDWADIGRRLAPSGGPTRRARKLFWLLDDSDAALASVILAKTPRVVLWVLRNGFSGGYNRAAYLMWVGGGTGPAI